MSLLPLRSVIEIPPAGTNVPIDQLALTFADGKETL